SPFRVLFRPEFDRRLLTIGNARSSGPAKLRPNKIRVSIGSNRDDKKQGHDPAEHVVTLDDERPAAPDSRKGTGRERRIMATGPEKASDPRGLERTSKLPKKTGSSRSEGAQEGAFRPKLNQNLTRRKEQLKALSPAERRAILAMIGKS